MGMGVPNTTGPGMSGSGSTSVTTTVPGGLHPGTVGPGSLGPGPGTSSSISISSGSMGPSNVVGIGYKYRNDATFGFGLCQGKGPQLLWFLGLKNGAYIFSHDFSIVTLSSLENLTAQSRSKQNVSQVYRI